MFNAFSKGISPKVKVIAQLGFELAHFKAAVQYFSHCTKGTPPLVIVDFTVPVD